MSTRKRRYHELYLKKSLKDFQKEIMSFLEVASKVQMENIIKLRKEFGDMKSEIQQIKNTTEVLSLNRSNINVELTAIKSENRSLREKLTCLDNTLSSIKESQQGSSKSISGGYEDQAEVPDCFKGGSIKALPIISKDCNISSDHNEDEVCTLLKTVYEGVPLPQRLAEQISKLRASQSPIAISVNRCPTWSSLDKLKFKGYWDNKSNGVLLNTGQTAYFTFDSPSRPILSGGPLIGEYIFEQMHFHWSVDNFTGCEHVLDGQGYAAECHLVHYNSKYESMEAAVANPDGLAVVGFLLEAVDAPNPNFDRFVEGLDQIKKQDIAVQIPSASLAWMDRADVTTGSYVTYKGSLTTPPYTECVTWIIYEKPVQIGGEQLGLLRQLEGADKMPIERNVRPTQRHPPGHSVIYVKQVKSKL